MMIAPWRRKVAQSPQRSTWIAEHCAGDQGARRHNVMQMTNRFKASQKTAGADVAQAVKSSHSRGTPEPRGPSETKGPNAVFERWLQRHLRQLYHEVCSEPVPDDLIDVIERLRRKRRGRDDDRSVPGHIAAPYRR